LISNKQSGQKPLEVPDNIYQAIINDIADSIVEIDLNGNFTYVSPQCYQMFGYNPHEVIGRKALRFIHPDDLLNVMNKMKTAIEDQKHVSYEYRAKHKNGGYVYVSAKGGIIKREGITKLIAVVRDITEKKIAEVKLKDSEHQYRTIIESMGDPIHVIDTDLRIILTNNTLKEWLDRFNIKEHLIGRKISSVFPFLPEKVFDEYHKVFETGKTLVSEEFTQLDEKAIYTEVRKIPVFVEGNVAQVVTIVKDITEKKIAEIKLKESEKEFRNIIENTKDAIVIIDFEGKLLYTSPQLSKMLNGREINKDSLFFPYIHKDDVKKLISFYKTTLKEKNFLEKPVEFRILPKHGDYMWFSSSSKNYYDDEGNVVGFISTLKDITDKKIAEQKLKESEQKYRLITEQSNDLIRVLNEKFEIEYVNEFTLLKLLGYSKEELFGKNSLILNHPEDYKKIRRFMLNLFKKGENMHETRIKHKNGSWLWFENKAKAFIDENGSQKYLLISRDITERKKSEKLLMESEEKYRNLYKNSPNAVLLSDKNGLILDMNSSAERILGYNKSEMIGRNYLEFNLVTSDQVSVIKTMYKKLLNGVKPKPTEFQIKKKNGNMAWIFFQNSMFKLDNEIIIESIAQDITDKKKAENLIIEENKRLLELNKMKSELISRVSHELKTPITSIFGGTQILLELYKDQTRTEAIEFIELINRGGKRLKILIENLLDASRIESEKLKLNLQKENIVDIVKNCINDNRILASKRNIILELNLPEVVTIVIDKIRIEQVITNLLSNAFKNTPKKGIIRIKLEEKDNAVYFKIKDTGIGLTKKEMEKLFTKFGKIERYGQKMDVDIEGSGLGLYISKEIVDLHGGHIWVESEGRNEGSTFYIKLFKNLNDLTT
jgi:PAS domain S-box-containing protein